MITRILSRSLPLAIVALIFLAESSTGRAQCCSMKFTSGVDCGFIYRVQMSNPAWLNGGVGPHGTVVQPFDCVFFVPTVLSVEIQDKCGQWITIPQNGCATNVELAYICCADICWTTDANGCIVINVTPNEGPCSCDPGPLG